MLVKSSVKSWSTDVASSPTGDIIGGDEGDITTDDITLATPGDDWAMYGVEGQLSWSPVSTLS